MVVFVILRLGMGGAVVAFVILRCSLGLRQFGCGGFCDTTAIGRSEKRLRWAFGSGLLEECRRIWSFRWQAMDRDFGGIRSHRGSAPSSVRN